MNRNTTARRRSRNTAGVSSKTSARAKTVAPAGEVEALLRSTLDALSAHIAVLNRTGTIVAVNQAWRDFATTAGFVGRDGGVGMNYLAVCERSAPASTDAAHTAAALRDILAGRRMDFRMEYPCESNDGLRWFQMRVTRPGRTRASRIVVAHEDITEVKLAQEQLARLSARLIRVQDEERRAIARELHDTTAQNLLAIALNATRLRKTLGEAGESARRILAETMGLAEQSLQEIRTLSYLLHPPLLDEMGLASALRWFAKGFSERSGIAVDVRAIEGDGPGLPREVATTLFRVAQEALSNVHRHSGSASARIALRRSEAVVRLDVTDRGRGLRRRIEPSREVQAVGVGIAGMRIRLEQLGGRLEIRSSGSGTRVSATVPIPTGCDGRVEAAIAADAAADGGRSETS
jgi:signal transduction histidine kinase